MDRAGAFPSRAPPVAPAAAGAMNSAPPNLDRAGLPAWPVARGCGGCAQWLGSVTCDILPCAAVIASLALSRGSLLPCCCIASRTLRMDPAGSIDRPFDSRIGLGIRMHGRGALGLCWLPDLIDPASRPFLATLLRLRPISSARRGGGVGLQIGQKFTPKPPKFNPTMTFWVEFGRMSIDDRI